MELGKHIVDRAILDRNGRRAGMVDDLALELPDGIDPGGGLPRVAAIVTGPTAFATQLPRPLPRLAGLLLRAIGLRRPVPVELEWDRVRAIDVVVHVDVDRDEIGSMALQEAAGRLLGRLPGS